MLVATLLMTGCAPDEELPAYDGGGIQAPDIGQPDNDIGRPDMAERPTDMGRDPDLSRPDAGQSDAATDMRRDPQPEPEAERSEPTAAVTAILGDPTTATTVAVTVTNLDDVPRLMRVGLVTFAGGRPQADEQLPERVEAGASTTATFNLRNIGIVTSTLELPASFTPRVIVEEADGSPIERVYGDAVEVGPTLTAGFAAVLASSSLQAADVPTNGIDGFQTVLAAAYKGDTGLVDGEILGPDEDGGSTLPTANYDDGVPDANGLFHYNICLRWPVNWVDAGFGEDYGVQPEGTWRARGSRVQIKADNQLIFDDWLDAEGCTGNLDTPTKTNFWIVGYSVAMANGNTVIVRDANGDIDSYVRIIPNVGGSGTKYYTFPQTNRSNLLAASTFTIARWGAVAGETFEVNDRCEPDFNQCCDCANSRGIWIDRRTRKFLISHEIGHRILSLYTNGYTNDCTKVITPSTLPCTQADQSSHALTSNEFSSCAAMEGWAHFVAARAYNNHLEAADPGATFQYWGSSGVTVDVEQGPTGGVNKFYENQCGVSGASAVGGGVELDWLRHWWDYHTDSSPASPVGLATMMDEIDERSNWTATNAYQTLSNGIELYSGADQLARWEAIAASNGVDH